MKTLDEVIKALDEKPVPMAYTAKVAVQEEDVIDALHYLREYRDKHDEMLKMEEALGYCEMADNRPLTWDELRQMRGKPVWIEDPGQKEWRIIDHVVDEDTKYERLYTQGFYPRTFYKHDHQWRAYRKELS